MADMRNNRLAQSMPRVTVRLSICPSSGFNDDGHVGKPAYEEDLTVNTVGDVRERVLDILNTDDSEATVYFHAPGECDLQIVQRDLNNHSTKVLSGQYVGFLAMHAHVDRIAQPTKKLNAFKPNPYSSYTPNRKIDHTNPYHIDRGSQLRPYSPSVASNLTNSKPRKKVHWDRSPPTAFDGFDDDTAPQKASLTTFKASGNGDNDSRKIQPSYNARNDSPTKFYRIGTKDTIYNVDKNNKHDDTGVPCEPWLIAKVPHQKSGRERRITLLAVKTWNFAGRRVGDCFLGEKLPHQMPTEWYLDPVFLVKHSFKSSSQLLFDIADGKITDYQVLASLPSGARLERKQIAQAPTRQRYASPNDAPAMQWANEEGKIFAVLCFKGQANNHDLGLDDDYQINLEYNMTCELIEDVLLDGDPNDEDFEGLYKSDFLSRKLGQHFCVRTWVLPNGKEYMYSWSAHRDWEARHWLDEDVIKKCGYRRLYIEVLIYDTREAESKAINEIDLYSDGDGDDEGDDESDDESEIADTMMARKKGGSNGNLKGKGKGKGLDKQVMGGAASSDGSTEGDEGDTGDEIVVAHPKQKSAVRKRTVFHSDEDDEQGPPNKAPRMDFGSRYH